MIIPIRCFTCGKVTGDKWEKYNKLLEDGKTSGEALTLLGLRRNCCRRIIQTHVELIDDVIKYDVNPHSEKI